MSAIDYADGLNERKVSFALFRSALHQNDLSASMGWEKSIDKLATYLSSPKTSKAYSDGLRDVYIDLTLHGNKMVRIYKLLGDYGTIIDLFKNEILETSTIYEKRFPLPLEHDKLVTAPLKIHCVNYYETDDEISFVFCSKQYITERETLPINSITDKVINDFGEFDEVIGVRNRAVQLFDVISINKINKTVQIRMDGLDIQRIKDIEKRLKYLDEKTFRSLEQKIDLAKNFEGPLNFFPAIKKLYDNPDGRVAEIGHTTTSAGVHTGKMRTRQLDFRRDQYHVGGAATVASLNAHMLSKCWDSPSKHGNVQLVIPGTVALTSAADPTIDIAYLLSCASDNDYNFLMTKLLASLQP